MSMPMDGTRSIRAYRPSCVCEGESHGDEAELVRLANMKIYTARAQAGLPIFEDPEDVPVRPRPHKSVV